MNNTKDTQSTLDEAIRRLNDFCSTIESTGGVGRQGICFAPVADEEWLDLGSAYEGAYNFLAKIGHPRDAKYAPENSPRSDDYGEEDDGEEE